MKTNNRKLFEEINKAFARSDLDFLIEHVTDTIRWKIVGDKTVEGKDVFAKTIREMEADEPKELSIYHIITHGKEALVNGEMESSDKEIYTFCSCL